MNSDIDVSIVVPCYCSGEWIEELCKRIQTAFNEREERIELILVNDASPDNGVTWRSIEQVSKTACNISGYDLVYNTGQYRTTICGIEHAKGSRIVTIDDDLQHDPRDIPSLLDKLNQTGSDCIIAAFEKKHHGPIRRIGTWFREVIFRTFYSMPRGMKATGFRAFTQNFGEVICSHSTAHPNLNAIIFKATNRVQNAEVSHWERPHGKSGYTLRKLVAMLFESIFSASLLPLKTAAYLGLLSAIMSSFAGFFYLARYALFGGSAVQGFTTLLLLNLLIGGLVLFAVGTLGEYLALVLSELKYRPRYFIRKKT